MARFNRFVATGNLGHDPEGRYLPDGTAITKFSMAIGFGKDRSFWMNITTFGSLAERCLTSLQKGSGVLIEGRLVEDAWKDDNGREHKRISVVASDVQFLSKIRQKSDTEDHDAEPKQEPKKEEKKDATGGYDWPWPGEDS